MGMDIFAIVLALLQSVSEDSFSLMRHLLKRIG